MLAALLSRIFIPILQNAKRFVIGCCRRCQITDGGLEPSFTGKLCHRREQTGSRVRVRHGWGINPGAVMQVCLSKSNLRRPPRDGYYYYRGSDEDTPVCGPTGRDQSGSVELETVDVQYTGTILYSYYMAWTTSPYVEERDGKLLNF